MMGGVGNIETLFGFVSAFIRGSRVFFQGVPGPTAIKKVWTTFFFFLIFSFHQFIFDLQRRTNGFITEIPILFQGS